MVSMRLNETLHCATVRIENHTYVEVEAICIFVELAGGIELKVHNLRRAQGNGHLPRVDRCVGDFMLPWCLPLVDAFVGADVSNALREHLQSKRIKTEVIGQKKLHGVDDGVAFAYRMDKNMHTRQIEKGGEANRQRAPKKVTEGRQLTHLQQSIVAHS